MAGLDSTGFVNKDVDTILAELEAQEKSALGTSFNVRPTSVAGVLNGAIGAQLSELWDLGNEVWASQNPDTATGTSLDQLCQLTGVTRESAEQSSVTLSLTGTPSTPIPALRRVKSSTTGRYVTNSASASIGAASTALVTFTAEDFGPVAFLSGTLTIIDTPVSGWSAVTNPSDAALGQDGETDAELRVRRAALLVATGQATLDAILADVIAVDGVLAATVFENFTNATDSDGLPSHSFEVVLDVGTASASSIAQSVWNNKPLGISAYGTSSGTAVDSLSGSRTVGFTPVTQKNVYVALTAVTGSGFSGLTADIASAVVVNYGGSRGIGADVFRFSVGAAAEVTGVTDISDLRLDYFASPTASSNLVVATRERAKFDSSRFTVTLA